MMSKGIKSALVLVGGFLMVGAALIGDGASSLIAGISVGRGGGSGNGGKVEGGKAKAEMWQKFMAAQTADELTATATQATEAGFEVSVTQG